MAVRPPGQWHFERLSADDMVIPDGAIRSDAAFGSDPGISRDNFELRSLVAFPIPLTSGRKDSSLVTLLAATPASGDLGLTAGTFGTHCPVLETSDAMGTTVTQKVVFEVVLPPEYEANQDVKIRVSAKMEVASDTTATVDVEVHKSDREGAVGSDLIAASPSAQSINSTSYAEKDFVLTDTNLEPGDKLMVRVTVAITDGSAGAGVIANIADVSRLVDLRG